ncbi:MAG TPA: glutamine--fructose-6-phosphate transaminase (isomerizing) [Patescibacteria group bacterium]|nr:glutamine--fructose-6-phosphate transaminase (isomerizing) [Patescibacteria group bacterium]
MCGIFGYVGESSKASKIVLEGLKSLEYRGYDSWGIAAVPLDKKKTSKIIVKKKTGKIGDATVDEFPPSSFAFGHTRWATHGGVTDVNAHPHLDCTGTIAIIHNGIVENYQELKAKLLKKGHKFISETDTEVAVHLIEEFAKTMLFSKAVQKAFNEMEGLNAFIVMNTKIEQFIAVRNGSPLVVGFGIEENLLASDAAALLPYTKQVHYLEDNEMALVSKKGIMIFNARTGDHIKPKKVLLTWSITQVEKGKYPYYMLKEIHEQPAIIADIAADGAQLATELIPIIKKADETYMVGCGTAAYACMAASIAFAIIAKRQVNAAIGSEFEYEMNFLTPNSVIFALSQSGETMDTLEAVRKAKTKKAKIVSLVNTMGSTLYRESDYQILIGAGPEKAVASTKAFTGKIAYALLLAYATAGNVSEGQKILTRAVNVSKQILSDRMVSVIEKLAKRIKNKEHIYVIGRGMSYPASLETALKIKEISYIHAEGFAAGELKHGVIALIEKDTPCIAFLPKDETYGANLAGAMEMKARGGFIIGISYKPHEVFDYYIPVPDAGIATIIPNVIVAQLLAYYLTIERGYDPDMPRNLAKSVTVK